MPPRKKPKVVEPSLPAASLYHLVVDTVTPELDGGRYPAKRVTGDVLRVGANVFKDGHELLSAHVLFKGPGDAEWSAEPMTYSPELDRWFASVALDRVGRWRYTVEGWTDRFGTWRSELKKKHDAGQDFELELREGSAMVREAMGRMRFGSLRATLEQTAAMIVADHDAPIDHRVHRALEEELALLMQRHHAPADVTRYSRELTLVVDRDRARTGAWYEFFPRSLGAGGRHGTFDDAAAFMPRVAGMGFDVVYLPPIHPIGTQFRKGRNNSLTPTKADVGSPWAIGSAEGGHDAIHPELGDDASFRRFVQRANELGIEVALDYALQCSPDHPWVREHPDWFHIRPDGSIQYAENPPKKYQDIFPINFWCEDRIALWNACRDVLLHWVQRGVRIFRVDNPHTKPSAFWEWVIREVQDRDPGVVFFAEAFTKPNKMQNLGKLGFTMSYTYFTWKNDPRELREYMEELTAGEMVEYYRGNLFTNTPDILNEYLVDGGVPAFRIRLVLAATLLPLYGIYSGYELAENVPVKPGSEEYMDSEKYELKSRDWNATPNITSDVVLLNRLRREEPALRAYGNLVFGESENSRVLCYVKQGLGAQGLGEWGTTHSRIGEVLEGAHIIVAVNCDPHGAQESTVTVPLEAMGMGADESYGVTDLLTGAHYTWRGARNYVRLDPAVQVAHVFRVERTAATTATATADPSLRSG
ncbi:MAG: alpha amylase catalytic region [Gemmatimonadetes bacterium]|nr:alpha amylase catalytic region [Gemmatimonadota bacterium]